MPSFSRLHCEDHDIAVVVIPDSPLAVRAVNSQPKENLAFRYHGENHQILEVLGQDDSPEDLYALGHASKIIVLRGKKALYTFGSAVDCNVRLAFPDASPKQLEMILQYGQTGVDIQYLDNKTRLNGKPVRAGTEHLSVEACIRIGHADFRVIPTSSLVPGCKTYQNEPDSPHSTPQSPSLAEFRKGKLVGEGGQGAVYRYRPANAEQQLVVKILELRDGPSEKAKQAIREATIVSLLDHEFLLQALDVFQYPDGFAIILPYLAFGSLEDYLEERRLFIDEAKMVVVQILLGVEYLHENDIIHRDLKPSNVLVASIEPLLKIKLADLGLAVMSTKAISAIGTEEFCAPEVYRKGRVTSYGKSVDIFSTGMLLLSVLGVVLSYSGYHFAHDFDDRVGVDVESAVESAQSEEKVVALRTAQTMAAFEPRDRPTAADCFNLPWFKQSQRKWRPDELYKDREVPENGSPLGPTASRETVRPRRRHVQDSQDRSNQPSKKLPNLKPTTRRRRTRYDKPSHKKSKQPEMSSSLSRLRR